MSQTISTHALFELFEFTPDGASRPPDGPGMYTWMLRRAQSTANLERISLPVLENGTRAGLLVFPDDVSVDLANTIANHLRSLPSFQDAPVSVDSGNAFRGTWTQGRHDWSLRAHALAIGTHDESLLFNAARLALEQAACDYLLVASPFRTHMCLASATPAKSRTASGFWPFRRKPGEWISGMRPATPLQVVRPFKVFPADAFANGHMAGPVEIRHAHWLQLVLVFRAICPELTDADESLLTNRSRRTLAADKSLALMLALRRLLQTRKDSRLVLRIGEASFQPDSEAWFWPQAEALYLLLSQCNSLSVE